MTTAEIRNAVARPSRFERAILAGNLKPSRRINIKATMLWGEPFLSHGVMALVPGGRWLIFVAPRQQPFSSHIGSILRVYDLRQVLGDTSSPACLLVLPDLSRAEELHVETRRGTDARDSLIYAYSTRRSVPRDLANFMLLY